MEKYYSYLALGDSYTIGEGVPVFESFPYQAVQILRREGRLFSAAEIVARTGWTTGELIEGIEATPILPFYDFVSLLIGVNNEYRGRIVAEYETEFEKILQKAILFAGDNPEHVFTFSIPDWGVTPFARAHLPDAGGRSPETVAKEIDAFNAAGRSIAGKYGVAFTDITQHTRASGTDPRSLTTDGLHPSGIEYRYWAEKLAAQISECIGSENR